MLKSPFLKRIAIVDDKRNEEAFPFSQLAFLNEKFTLDFSNPVTFFVGENGSGKSTVLEAIAEVCGFHKSGGSHMHQNYHSDDGVESTLSDALSASWLPKVNQGFFFRSESFFNVARYVDTEGYPTFNFYGGKALHSQSHGESFLAVFSNAFVTDERQMFLMDEPETALSPQRQLSFLSLLSEWEKSGNCQLVIATHSPILLAYPNARIIEFTPDGLRDVEYEETEHYKFTKTFLNNPQRYLKELME
ncbi:conserved hypothetical protein [Candidatus Terasakiella magnetica]|uniref:AAA+ ATPase domain-containing protein n=1 Tax=Candidatus Terasakiella magnetica TaxID=1867952 RepID=A0A1C3RF95_9PROT|nr:AAA family ATPase [Candidatus Terasakiella magnetica]SCA55966.1 conserved hypothetical protein [Candidatus Terasakiella magnetica]